MNNLLFDLSQAHVDKSKIKAIQNHSFRETTCQSCTLRSLCLPLSLTNKNLEQLDSIIARGRPFKKGDLLYFNTWGGGGWGDPYERDPELVRADVDRDLVSVGGAKRYGVDLGDNGHVNVDATEALRDSLRPERAEPEFSAFGGALEHIIPRCKEETHLDPPSPPSFAGDSN